MKAWEKKESSDAKAFGAKKTPRSGGLWFAKGDMKDKYFSYDSKDTKFKSFTITSELWKKIYEDALKANRMPVLSIKLGTGEEIVALSRADFVFIKEFFERGLTTKE